MRSNSSRYHQVPVESAASVLSPPEADVVWRPTPNVGGQVEEESLKTKLL